MNPIVNEKLDNIYAKFSTNPKSGLSEDQVKNIQAEKGLNKFDEEKKETLVQKIFHHLTEFTILILLVGTIISFYMAVTIEGSGYAKPIIILSIIVISIGLAIYQEKGAEKALDALKNLNSPKATVLRNRKKENYR